MIHEMAAVDEGAVVGVNTYVWHWTHICSGAKVGSNCKIGQNVFIGSKAEVGDGVKIQNNVSVYDAVRIENNVFIGPSVVFTNVINPRAHVVRRDSYSETIVKNGSNSWCQFDSCLWFDHW